METGGQGRFGEAGSTVGPHSGGAWDMAKQRVVEYRWSKEIGVERSGNLVCQEKERGKERGGLGRAGVEGETTTGAGTQRTVNQMVQECTYGSSETGGKSRPAGSRLPRKSGTGAWLGVCITSDSPTP